MPTPVTDTQIERTPHTVLRRLQPGWPVPVPTTHNSEYRLAVADTVSSTGDGVRRDGERIVDSGDASGVMTSDHERVGMYTEADLVETTLNGEVRVETHSQFGYSEFRVRPTGSDRVPGRPVKDSKPDRGGR